MSFSRALFRSEEFTVGEFHCLPDDPAWHEENSVGPGRHVVFPGTGVRIAQDGREPLVVDPNHVVFYEEYQTYRRELVCARGDHCVFVIPSPGLLLELSGESDGELGFSATWAPADVRAYLLQHHAVRYLREADLPDPDVVRESFLEVLRRVLERRRPGSGPSRRASTECDHRDAVEAAKAYLDVHAAERVMLADVAAHVHRSVFHLARLFKERTGTTVHAYLTQVRLRAALQDLAEGSDIARVALDHGFSSHAHFTGSFTSAFGMPPSAVRGEPSKFLEAVHAGTS